MNIEIALLGRFEVRVDDRAVPDDAWERRQAQLLVKLLALAPGRQLHREQAIDAVWPDLSIDDAAPRLHKAAHYARKAMGARNGVVLRRDVVSLFPDDDVTIDALDFAVLAECALRDEDGDTLARAIERYGGTLLPTDLYEPWTEARREQLNRLYADLLRRAERWDELLAQDEADETAHLAVMQERLAAGDHVAVLRQYERMDRVLRRELGMAPGSDAVAVRDEALRNLGVADSERRSASAKPPLVGRSTELATFDGVLAQTATGRGHAIFVSGPPGIGKTALLDELRRRAAANGWRVGGGDAAAIEGAWPYAPVLEAFADLGRRHPALLDGLDDTYRAEIDQARAGIEPRRNPAHEIGHQRLFVAASELLRLAAAGTGAMLVIDDAHDADDATLRMLHYLARSSVRDRVVLVLAHRSGIEAERLDQMRTSLERRAVVTTIPLTPLDRDGSSRLLDALGVDATPAQNERLWAISGGIPFSLVELARRGADADVSASDAGLSTVPRETREVLQRVAIAGTAFDTDEFVALAGLDDDEAFRHLDVALAAQVVERRETGYRFRHALLRDALLGALAPHQRRRAHRDAAERLAAIGASPARVGHHLLQAGDPGALPYLLQAAETEAALGAYREALELVDAARPNARGDVLARLLALRGDLLFATGDPRAVAAYRQALELTADAERLLLRAKLARAALFAGDLDTASIALAGVDTNGGTADSTIMIAKAHQAYFQGDIESATVIANEARELVLRDADNWQLLDLVGLQGLIAHNRGEWFDKLRTELRQLRDEPSLATAVFDGHLCVAEYLLYGPVPYAELLELAEKLRASAQRAGVLRAVAFAAALAGEAALLAGNLERAERELEDAADLHREVGAPAGEAHSLQRLAEVSLAQGDRAHARGLLDRALPTARFSAIAHHVLQRVYGTMIMAAETPQDAVAVVDAASEVLGPSDHCMFCAVMFEVPATIACADAGDIARARHYLELAERSASLWHGSSWSAAVSEACAHVAAAEGRGDDAVSLLDQAATMFERAGQPLDALRCVAGLPATAPSSP